MTPHDIEVLRAYGRTGSIQGAAETMDRSPHTIKSVLNNLRAELGVCSVGAAIYKVFVEPDVPLQLRMACGCAPGTHDNTILAMEQAHPEQWVIDGIHDPHS